MTPEQITKYEYCKKHLADIKKWIESLPFKIQRHGCGSNAPNIEYTLENIHHKMHINVSKAMQDAETEIQTIIDNL